MTLALALILVGALLMYAGVTGQSVRALLVGKSGVPSSRPATVARA